MPVITKSVRVLIVDDQESFRSAARLVIESTDGFEVAGEAATGEEAVRAVAEMSPDLVLMDMNLPGIDGPEATRQILGYNPDIKVVGLSTYEEYHDRALAAGAVAFIAKSEFEPGRLSRAWSGK
ncbi:MAG: response regulator transcription factor, partial [Acidimicrobiia bacterium]